MHSDIAEIGRRTQGIGFLVARLLIDAGFIVFVGSRDAVRGASAVRTLGERARALPIDVTDAKSVALTYGGGVRTRRGKPSSMRCKRRHIDSL